ncbi:hypothetical protein Cgig2_008898 [Carnegiea gigantea]|uniref:Peptidase A2 domain-containing protein n=1 Tax=Carnegiea gigantea TaxID=171969 RepID=A0A9Q1QKE7_9CARY|nr:hypothetical protein Cgig2_008898 [Carnegiea gigantea]
MKVASAIVRRILLDTGSSMDIITWDCLKKLTYPGRDIIPLVHPILGFGGQHVNPTGVIRLLLCFRDKGKEKNLELDFLVVDVPWLIISSEGDLLWIKVLTSPSISVVPSSSRSSPSPEGGIERQTGKRGRKEEDALPTSATTTFSSVTSKGSEVPEMAKSNDLVRSRTSSNLAAELAARKFVGRTWALTGVSPTVSRATWAAFGVQAAPCGTGVWPPTDRSADRGGGDVPLPSLPVIEDKVEAVASSRRSSICERLCLPAGGRLIVGFFLHGTRGVPTTRE